jgi:hypothetical protein
VEVEDGIEVDGAGFAAAVEATLGDPRSWGNGGRMSFQRVGQAEAEARQYAFKVTLISPGNMERYCPGVGTGGYTSCRYGDRAVINLARWATAVPDYQGDIPTYRHYVVNHEVGHALGNGHRPCTGPGSPPGRCSSRPLGLEGCAKNARAVSVTSSARRHRGHPRHERPPRRESPPALSHASAVSRVGAAWTRSRSARPVCRAGARRGRRGGQPVARNSAHRRPGAAAVGAVFFVLSVVYVAGRSSAWRRS